MALCALGVLGTACGQDDSRAPNYGYNPTGGSGGVGGGVGGGAGGAAGQAGAPQCTPNPALGSKLSGDLVTYDLWLKDKQPWKGQAEIKTPGANCPSVSVIWDGSAPSGSDAGAPYFTLESVKTDPTLFAHFYPINDPALYPTMMLIEMTGDKHIVGGMGMVSSAGVDSVYAAMGITRDETKGTLIVQLLAPLTNAPQSGGKVNVGLNGTPAFPAAGGGWVADGETDPSGIAVMLNTTAKPFPGNGVAVNVELGIQKKTLGCAAESGAVSICWIGIGS